MEWPIQVTILIICLNLNLSSINLTDVSRVLLTFFNKNSTRCVNIINWDKTALIRNKMHETTLLLNPKLAN